MPEMIFRVRWPDGAESDCYSPSLVVRDHLVPGTDYPVTAFLARAEAALTEASVRVQARYGFPCRRALGQLQAIRETCGRFAADGAARVRVVSFH
ncbi:MSMEG_0570 family nitrogen starvation response protein [Gluconacetobacter takamatsuzukensis]|uniref:MSMEG_0570 family nitrogen starvation response protein n=1 Tax=Gluconacetobacter takamatsuzukensis TaxID=1286190 RepID=A0A7W4KDG4_9PROT|nr:MSMEG_0570 family nitrogen starvation response protein [Gluconacetobacter takamatsuzukensis]MBB2204933.1 MSMEG_0570 family nitrogen starvation response protein [Gluconacetobacter takamatsuzukensis]